MDYGDDPMLSARYAQIHATADALLRPNATGRLETLLNRHKWTHCTLDELRDQGVTAEMLSASGAKWPVLQAKHGTNALVRFGYTWPLMLQSGFTARHLSQLTCEQLTHLGVNATRAMECRPRVADVSALQLSSTQLASMGWNEEMLRAIGLNMQNMIGFGYSLSAWKSHLGVDSYAALGFANYAACAAAGWHDADIQMAMNAQAPEVAAPPKGSRAPGYASVADGKLRFI